MSRILVGEMADGADEDYGMEVLGSPRSFSWSSLTLTFLTFFEVKNC
jgi:hypothetical protein